jgi:hypothetical protein
MELRRTEITRREIKSSEGEFICKLKNSCEISPKLSEQILITQKESLLRGNWLKEGQIEVVTRGYLHNIGRGQADKVKIIGMYFDGKTFSEINLKPGIVREQLSDTFNPLRKSGIYLFAKILFFKLIILIKEWN